MAVGVLIGIAIMLSILLILDKRCRRQQANHKIEEEEVFSLITSRLEDDYLTELLVDHQQDFEMKGKILNGLYRVERILGEGGIGRVFLCQNIKLGNHWAVKFIPNQKNTEARKALAGEDILKKLNHIHLPQIVDIFEDEAGVYLVESYIEGISLDKKFKEEGPFTEDQVLRWSLQLIDVLIYLHGIEPHPIIYGDMKPSNVMITPDDRAVLIDFGVALEYRGEMGRGTPPSAIGLTAKFAAPEQIKGYADITSDIYSLGVMMYYLLTGEFFKKDFKMKSQSRKISKGMIEILEGCLKNDISQRYQTAKQLKEELKFLNESKKGLLKVFIGKQIYQTPPDYKKLIVIMSPEATGKTTIAVNLAWDLSEKGVRTTLIDTDFHKKDVYYYFPKNFANCLGNYNLNPFLQPQKINKYLSIYTDHRDVEVDLEAMEIRDLILQSKREAQVVIIDLGRDLEETAMREILALADHKILVVDQRINLLNRIPQKIYNFRDLYRDIDLIINRYVPEGYTNEKNIKGFFKGIEVGEGDFFDVKIKRCFHIREDYLGILNGLENRKPPIVNSKKLTEDIERLSKHYYRLN